MRYRSARNSQLLLAGRLQKPLCSFSNTRNFNAGGTVFSHHPFGIFFSALDAMIALSPQVLVVASPDHSAAKERLQRIAAHTPIFLLSERIEGKNFFISAATTGRMGLHSPGLFVWLIPIGIKCSFWTWRRTRHEPMLFWPPAAGCILFAARSCLVGIREVPPFWLGELLRRSQSHSIVYTAPPVLCLRFVWRWTSSKLILMSSASDTKIRPATKNF